jgi:hypothetical protein
VPDRAAEPRKDRLNLKPISSDPRTLGFPGASDPTALLLTEYFADDARLQDWRFGWPARWRLVKRQRTISSIAFSRTVDAPGRLLGTIDSHRGAIEVSKNTAKTLCPSRIRIGFTHLRFGRCGANANLLSYGFTTETRLVVSSPKTF